MFLVRRSFHPRSLNTATAWPKHQQAGRGTAEDFSDLPTIFAFRATYRVSETAFTSLRPPRVSSNGPNNHPHCEWQLSAQYNTAVVLVQSHTRVLISVAEVSPRFNTPGRVLLYSLRFPGISVGGETLVWFPRNTGAPCPAPEGDQKLSQIEIMSPDYDPSERELLLIQQSNKLVAFSNGISLVSGQTPGAWSRPCAFRSQALVRKLAVVVSGAFSPQAWGALYYLL